MPDLLAESRTHAADLAEGGLIVGDDACADAVAIAAEVYTLADIMGKLIEVVERQDQMLGFLLDMAGVTR